MNIYIILLVILLVLVYNYVYNKETFMQGTKYTDMNNYDVEEIPGFLTPEECQKIIELSNGKLFPSKVYSQNDDLLSSDTRQSQQCWLTDENPIIKNISDKVKEYTKTYNNKQEQLQVVNYTKGGFFSPHYEAEFLEKNPL
jgi:hypothetical protein